MLNKDIKCLQQQLQQALCPEDALQTGDPQRPLLSPPHSRTVPAPIPLSPSPFSLHSRALFSWEAGTVGIDTSSARACLSLLLTILMDPWKGSTHTAPAPSRLDSEIAMQGTTNRSSPSFTEPYPELTEVSVNQKQTKRPCLYLWVFFQQHMFSSRCFLWECDQRRDAFA